jgi:hypothetical protein
MSVPGNLYTPTIRKTRGGGYIIEGSALFTEAGAGYLSKNVASNVSGTKFTLEAIFKPSNITDNQHFFSSYTDSGNYFYMQFHTAAEQIYVFDRSGSVNRMSLLTTRLFRDPSAYYHVLFSYDSTPATPDQTSISLYVNGVQVTDFDTEIYPAQNHTTLWGTVRAHYLGRFGDPAEYSDQYVSRIAYRNGVADGDMATSGVGEFDADGYWQINDVSGLDYTGGESFLIEGGDDIAAGLDSSLGDGLGFRKTNPNMTSATLPSGTVSDGGTYLSFSSYNAFDGNPLGTQWHGSNTLPNFIAYESSAAKVVTKVSFVQSQTNARSIKDWKVQGWDGASYVDLHTETGWPTQSSSNVTETVTFTNTTAYSKYRLYVTANQGGDGNYIGFYDVQFLEEGYDGNNHFNVNGTITATNDSPTDDAENEYGNFATWNPLFKHNSYAGVTAYLEGNTKADISSGVNHFLNCNIGITEGHFYSEHAVTRGDSLIFGIRLINNTTTTIGAGEEIYWNWSAGGVTITKNGVATQTGLTAFSNGDILGIEFDADTNSIQFYRNGSTLGTAESLTTAPSSSTIYTFFGYLGSSADEVTSDFGQKGFTYTPPTGAKALATQNMPAADVPNPGTEYYQGKFTTESSGNTTVTIPSDLTLTDGFMVRIKRISGATQDWYYCDTVNGAGKHFPMDATSPTQGRITDANLFVSTSGQDIVFGTSLTASTEYLIEVFKIGDYFSVNNVTMTAGPTGTYNPGLGVAPGFIVGLQQSAATNQAYLYHRSLGKNAYLSLNNTNTVTTLSNAWGLTAPSASSVTVNVLFDNATTVTFYNWGQGGPYHFGTQEGNASANGPMATVNGFPQATFIKPVDTAENWTAHFSAIDTYNPRNTELNLRSDAVAGGSGTDDVDFLSNGLKIRGTNTSINPSSTVVYGLFGLRPIQGDDGVTQGRAR